MQLLHIGVEQLDWVSTAFPDFLAKANAAVCGDLQSTVDQVHGHMEAIACLTRSWAAIEGLDMFRAATGPLEIAELEEKHQ